MRKDLTWDDAYDIGILLSGIHPEVEPLSLGSTDLQRYVTALPGFKDDPAKSDDRKLEAIRLAWHDEFMDRTQG